MSIRRRVGSWTDACIETAKKGYLRRSVTLSALRWAYGIIPV